MSSRTGLIAIALPDLGTAPFPVRVSSWFVDPGDGVEVGDRVVEVLIRGITCDISAPATGRMDTIVKDVDALVVSGDVLAWIQPDSAETTWPNT